MKLFIMLIITGFAYISGNNIAYAISKAPSYAITVTNISDSCEYGKSISIIDYNEDGIYDCAWKDFCDGTLLKDTLIVVGFGELSNYLTSEMIEGELEENNFKLRVYHIFSRETIAYIYRKNDTMYLDYTMVTNISSDDLPSNIKYHFSQNLLKIYHPDIIIRNVQIADLEGKEIDRKTYSIENSAHDTSINFPENIVPGPYFVILFFDKQSYTIKLQI
jgi:hypothetical protein